MADHSACEDKIMKSAAPFIATSAAIGGIAGGVIAVKLAAPVVVPMTVASVAAGAVVGGASLSSTAYALTADNKESKVPKAAAALGGTAGATGGAMLAASPVGAVAAVGAVAGAGVAGGVAFVVAKSYAELACKEQKVSHADASEVLPPLATPVAAAPAKGPVRS